MNRIKAMTLSFACLFVVGACAGPERVGADADQSQPTNQKLNQAERDFFDRGHSIK